MTRTNKGMTSLSPKKRVVSSILRAHSTFIDRVNRVPLFSDFVKANIGATLHADRASLYRDIAARLHGAPIDYLEYGVHRGESIAQWAALNTDSESRFVGFDSFEGLPEDWDYLRAGAFSTQGAVPRIDDTRVVFVRGWFQDTLDDFLRQFQPRNRLVVNNDSDLYSSTLYTLTKIDHLLVPGSIIFFDEFDDVQHEFRAMNDYASAYRKTFRLLGATPRFRTAAFEVV